MSGSVCGLKVKEVDINPFNGLYNVVMRQSACAANASHLCGLLMPNMYADICVMAHNIVECDPEDILKTSCMMTVVGGKIIYRKKKISPYRETGYLCQRGTNTIAPL